MLPTCTVSSGAGAVGVVGAGLAHRGSVPFAQAECKSQETGVQQHSQHPSRRPDIGKASTRSNHSTPQCPSFGIPSNIFHSPSSTLGAPHIQRCRYMSMVHGRFNDGASVMVYPCILGILDWQPSGREIVPPSSCCLQPGPKPTIHTRGSDSALPWRCSSTGFCMCQGRSSRHAPQLLSAKRRFQARLACGSVSKVAC